MTDIISDRRAGSAVNQLRLDGLVGRKAQRLGELMARSGQTGNPYALALRSTFHSIYAAAVLIPVAVVGSLYLWAPLFLLGLLPPVVLFLPEVRLRDKAAQRREGDERELPFFSILVNVLGSAGVSLYSIFESLTTNEIFDSMKREALLLKRDVNVFGMNPNESFERLAAHHPSKKFSDFIYGYTSKVRSGGDIPSYLAGESDSLLRQLEEGWVRYASRVGVIGSMMITFFGVIPLLLMIVGVFSPGSSIIGLVAFTGVGVPLFTILLVYLAGSMQPVGEEPLKGNALRSLSLALPGLAGGLLTRQLWVGTALMLSIFFVAYGLSVRLQLRETKEIEEGLTGFMKDLMEYKRQEYDLTKAVLSIASRNRYNSSFDRLISGIAAKLRAGLPIDEVRVTSRSRLGKLVFHLVGQMSRSGGGSVDTVYQLSKYTNSLVEMKRNARAEMRPYVLLSYLSPLLLAFGVAFIGGVLGSFSSAIRPGLAGLKLSNVQTGELPPALSQVSDLLIVVSASALGLIGAKITDLTVRNTLRASVNVGIAVAAMVSMSVLNLHSLVL